jgi:hypothetical protein
MRNLPPRPAQPHTWRAATLTGAAVTLAVSTAAMADMPRVPNLTAPATQLWLAQAEGGEGGEAGAIAGALPEVAYLAQLAIVEGHLAAAALMYRKGLVDEAVGLSYHPEAEMMDEVRETLSAHDVPDITPSMTAFSEAMERGATPDEVDLALADVSAAVAAASRQDATAHRTRFDAIVVLLRAAAHEYSESTESGVVDDITPYHEAYGFVSVAKALAQGLSTDADPAAAAAATRVLSALTDADEAFGDLTTGAPVAREPAILLSVAARVELIASSVR